METVSGCAITQSQPRLCHRYVLVRKQTHLCFINSVLYIWPRDVNRIILVNLMFGKKIPQINERRSVSVMPEKCSWKVKKKCFNFTQKWFTLKVKAPDQRLHECVSLLRLSLTACGGGVVFWQNHSAWKKVETGWSYEPQVWLHWSRKKKKQTEASRVRARIPGRIPGPFGVWVDTVAEVWSSHRLLSAHTHCLCC